MYTIEIYVESISDDWSSEIDVVKLELIKGLFFEKWSDDLVDTIKLILSRINYKYEEIVLEKIKTDSFSKDIKIEIRSKTENKFLVSFLICPKAMQKVLNSFD